jgi:hypothetical protein
VQLDAILVRFEIVLFRQDDYQLIVVPVISERLVVFLNSERDRDGIVVGACQDDAEQSEVLMGVQADRLSSDKG